MAPKFNRERPVVEHPLVVGEALVDVVDGRALPGGSPANVAVALGRLGQPVTLATQLGQDAHSHLVHEHLYASGVTVLAAPAAQTSVARAIVDGTGAATYDFDVSWDPDFGDLTASHVVHVGSFSAVTGPAVLDLLERSTGTISYDINVRPALLPPDAGTRVEAIVSRADIVKASDEDLEWLYPSRPAEETARALLDCGPSAVYLTLGAAGAVVLTREGTARIPGVRVEVADTIGAGDTFAAGVLHGLEREGCLGGRLSADLETLRRVGRFAAGLAAQTAARHGANPPWGVQYPRELLSH
jgi:fructokinase